MAHGGRRSGDVLAALSHAYFREGVLTTSNGTSQEVLIFTPHRIHGGGVVNFTEVLMRHLSPGYKAQQFFMGRRPGWFGNMLRLIAPVYDAIRLIRLLVSKQHDVYHINPSFTLRSVVRDGMFLLILLAFRRRNVLVFIHGWDEEFYRRLAASRGLRALFATVYRRAARVLVLASSFAGKLELLGLPRNRICVVTTMFEGESIQAAARRRTDQSVQILFMARFVATKGVYELLQAIKRINECGTNAILIMAGDGPEDEGLRRWCATHDLQHNVHFTGYVKDLEKAQLLSNADIFVLPSHGEGCPIALLEAMAAGLPVIVTSVGGIPDIVQDGVNGVVLDTPESTAISDALLRLSGDADLRARMGQRNREEAWEKYEAYQVTGRIEQEYRALAVGT